MAASFDTKIKYVLKDDVLQVFVISVSWLEVAAYVFGIWKQQC